MLVIRGSVNVGLGSPVSAGVTAILPLSSHHTCNQEDTHFLSMGWSFECLGIIAVSESAADEDLKMLVARPFRMNRSESRQNAEV